jgi:VanZ family protein
VTYFWRSFLQENMIRLFQAAAWIIVAAIILLSVVPPSLRPTTPIPHKLEHLVIFAIAGLAFGLGYRLGALYQIVGMIFFAGVIEIAQLAISGRHARMSDFVMHAIGACVGVVVGALIFKALSAYGEAVAAQ